jgi:hypothetical protein
MNAVVICQEMKWTYQEYLEQPTWFISLLAEKLNHDGKEMKKAYGRKKS